MMGRVAAAALSALAAAAVTAACGSDSAPPPPPTADPAVAWAERVCTSVEAGGAKLSQIPQIDPADPAKAKEGLVAYLTTITEAMGGVADGIEEAGAPPVVDGEQAVAKAMDRIEEVRTSLTAAKDRVAAAPVGDPAAFQQAIAEIGPSLNGLDAGEGPTADLKENPHLRDAFTKAPACQRVDGATGAPATP